MGDLRRSTARQLTAASMLAAASLVSFPAAAQEPPRIGWIYPASARASTACVAAFKDAMRDRGMVEGRQYVLDLSFADGDHNRFPVLAKEALLRHPAVMIGQTTAAIRAMQQATRTVPIVFMGVNHPVGSGLVSNLARPEGNTTGSSNMGEDLMAKHVELISEILPKAKRVAVLFNPTNDSHPKMVEAVRASATRLGLAMQSFGTSTPKDLVGAFDSMSKYRPEALIVITDAMLVGESERVAALALKHRLPSIAGISTLVDAGGLISYGAPGIWFCQSGAPYVSSLLKGVKPADLPIQQPTVFEVLVNSKTAKALGIALPKSVMARADRVIE